MAEGQRRDLFGECNVDAHPIDDFIRECCANCLNPECTRSLSGKAKFDARTANWFENYFGDKNRMDPKDPRFSGIAAKRFIIIDPGLTGPVPQVGGGSAWLDPRDVERQPPPPPAAALPAPPPPPAEPAPPAVAVARVEAPPAPPARSPAPKPPPSATPGALHLLLANAPAQKGQMIPRPPSANTAPAQPKDPWAGPVPDPTDTTPVVSPGARVKMGGSGV